MEVSRVLESDDDLFNVISACSTHLGLPGLARLAASSNRLREACLVILRRDTLSLLGPAMDATNAAAADKHGGYTQYTRQLLQMQPPSEMYPSTGYYCCRFRQQAEQREMHAVAWLLRSVPAAVSGSMSDQLVRLPMVNIGVAKQLVRAGVRITYKQLLAAANSMVPGVEVWVQVQHRQGIHTDIPAAVTDTFCGHFAVRT
jgi:hypothetical protein